MALERFADEEPQIELDGQLFSYKEAFRYLNDARKRDTLTLERASSRSNAQSAALGATHGSLAVMVAVSTPTWATFTAADGSWTVSEGISVLCGWNWYAELTLAGATLYVSTMSRLAVDAGAGFVALAGSDTRNFSTLTAAHRYGGIPGTITTTLAKGSKIRPEFARATGDSTIKIPSGKVFFWMIKLGPYTIA